MARTLFNDGWAARPKSTALTVICRAGAGAIEATDSAANDLTAAMTVEAR